MRLLCYGISWTNAAIGACACGFVQGIDVHDVAMTLAARTLHATVDLITHTNFF